MQPHLKLPKLVLELVVFLSEQLGFPFDRMLEVVGQGVKLVLQQLHLPSQQALSSLGLWRQFLVVVDYQALDFQILLQLEYVTLQLVIVTLKLLNSPPEAVLALFRRCLRYQGRSISPGTGLLLILGLS